MTKLERAEGALGEPAKSERTKGMSVERTKLERVEERLGG